MRALNSLPNRILVTAWFSRSLFSVSCPFPSPGKTRSQASPRLGPRVEVVDALAGADCKPPHWSR